MKWPPVVEAWLYGDPAEIGDALVARLQRDTLRASRVRTCAPQCVRVPRDRYYTQARRLHVKQLMRGRR
ncbi:MAG TPA: hypothetical protein VJ797_15610 [Burkholderiales bacterium]|nr:hypothetical protein [Burkholderiales bacterium]